MKAENMTVLRSIVFTWLLLSASVACVAVSAQDTKLHRIDLDGNWTFSIHGHGTKVIVVPSSYQPVGGATLERTFDALPHPDGWHGLLQFDAISTTGQIYLNDQLVGQAGPFTPFRLDVTNFLRVGRNTLRVELSDLDGFDPWNRQWLPAFPRYGGILRDVFLEWKPPAYIDNVRLDYRLEQNYSSAACNLQVWIVNTTSTSLRVRIFGQLSAKQTSYPFSLQATIPPGGSTREIRLSVPQVELWSPDNPSLYRLSVSIVDDNHSGDQFITLTGFREFVAHGQDFFLNGKKFFIKGIFRHDMFGDQGHTMSTAQMEMDLADIKSLGANFVRLGHYPHHEHVVETAARYGLLVSEEPPIFAMDQKDPKVIQAAQFCLGGVIRRDWNNPAVVTWFLSNEVGTDLEYMKQMSSYVRSLDPSRLVGIVDNTKWTADTAPWSKFREAKIDFIAQNAYGSGLDGSYEKLAAFLPKDLPYLISEWGGTNDSYRAVLSEGQYYIDHSNLKLNEGPRIAGICFWQYSDIPSPRWSPEDLLHWSITDKYRHPYETYYALKSLYTGVSALPPRSSRLVSPVHEVLPRPLAPYENVEGYERLGLSSQVNSYTVVKELKAASELAYPNDLTLGRVSIGGLPFELERQVILLSEDHPRIRIAVGKPADEIEFLGHVCFNSLLRKMPPTPGLPYLSELGFGVEYPPPFKGYPQAGKFGELVAQYVISYEDGETESVPLYNGIHFADYRLFFGLSDIDSIATDTERVLVYKGDFGTKRYQLRLFSYRPKRPTETISYIDFELKDSHYIPILAGITLQAPSAHMNEPDHPLPSF